MAARAIMADDSVELGIYAKSLEREAQTRYIDKLRFNQNTKMLTDPYNIPTTFWKNDPSLWPDLSFAQVFMYLIDTPSMFSPKSMKAYKSLDAYKYLESGHVQEVWYFDVEASPFCFMKASVLPSMKIRDKCHQPWVCLHKETADVYCAHCTCLAGLGEMCSHIAAVLFKIELGVRYGLTQKSTTSEACTWNKCFRKQLESLTVTEMEKNLCKNRKHTVEATIPSSRDPLPSEDVIEQLRSAVPEAAFFTLIPRTCRSESDITFQEASVFQKFPPILTSYFNTEAVAVLKSEEIMTKLGGLYPFEKNKNLHDATRNQNISPLWHQHRNGRITGSKAHDIITRRPSTCPNNLVKRIMGYKSYDLSKNQAVRWGIDHENEAKQHYIQYQVQHHTGFICDPAGFQISNYKWFIGATADGLIKCECCGQGCLEIKCPHKHKDILISEAIIIDSDFCLSPGHFLKTKHRYYTQIQCQIAVNQVEYCDLCVFTIPSFTIVRISKDANFISELFEKCSDFYINFVLPELLTKTLQREITDSTTDQDIITYCICQEPEYGRMIMCDSPTCSFIWFHYGCVNIKRKPKGKWFCFKCKD